MWSRKQTYMQLVVAMVYLCCLQVDPMRADTGAFEANADVGKIELPGTAEFDKAKQQYRVTGSGENMWKAVDAFHFVYRKITGDATLTADIAFAVESKTPHRKAGCLFRQTLDADSPYADAMVHGDGSIGLQYRKEKGGLTEAMKATAKAPATVRLERRGDVFTLYVTPKDGAVETVGPVKLSLGESAYVGLAVCSHDAKASETAIFSKVEISPAADPTKVKN